MRRRYVYKYGLYKSSILNRCLKFGSGVGRREVVVVRDMGGHRVGCEWLLGYSVNSEGSRTNLNRVGVP